MYTQLMNAIEQGDLEKVRELLANEINLEEQSADSQTPLTLAAEKGHTNIVIELLKHGAKIDEANRKGFTALIIAAHRGHLDTIKELLNRGADIDKTGFMGFPALLSAVTQEHREVIKLLINAGSDLLIKTSQDEIISELLGEIPQPKTFSLLMLLQPSFIRDFIKDHIKESFKDVTDLGKIELLRAFTYMSKYLDGFNLVLPPEDIINAKEYLEANNPFKVFKDVLTKDLEKTKEDQNTTTELKNIKDALSILKHVARHEDSLELDNSIKLDLVKLYKYVKISKEAKYAEFAQKIQIEIKSYLTKAIDASGANLLSLPNELFAKIFYEVLIANRLIQSKNNVSDSNNNNIADISNNVEEKLICANNNLMELDFISHQLEKLGSILDSFEQPI